MLDSQSFCGYFDSGNESTSEDLSMPQLFSDVKHSYISLLNPCSGQVANKCSTSSLKTDKRAYNRRLESEKTEKYFQSRVNNNNAVTKTRGKQKKIDELNGKLLTLEQVQVAEEVEQPDNELDEFLDAWADLQIAGGINNNAEVQDYLAVDWDVVTGGDLTLAEIVAEVSAVEADDDEVGDSEAVDIEEVEAEQPMITRQEAQAAFNLARRFVEKNSADPVILGSSDKLDDFFYKQRQKNEKQTKLTNFFPNVN